MHVVYIYIYIYIIYTYTHIYIIHIKIFLYYKSIKNSAMISIGIFSNSYWLCSYM